MNYLLSEIAICASKIKDFVLWLEKTRGLHEIKKKRDQAALPEGINQRKKAVDF